MTKGEEIVRVDFNSSGDYMVDDLKKSTAKLIDLVDSIKNLDPRLSALAITHLEIACMVAVKCATTKK